MRLATIEDREKVVNILEKAYADNPSFLWIVKDDAKKKQRIRKLCEYTFDVTLPIKGVYISDNEAGVSMFYRMKDREANPIPFIQDLKLAFNVVGLKNALGILKREKYIKKHRYKGDCLYFWMLAVDPDVAGLDTMKDLRNHSYDMSWELQIPLVAETTVKRNMVMYKRYGFETYHEWKVPGKDVTIWFMKREPKQLDVRR